MNHQPKPSMNQTKCCEKCVDGLVYPTSLCLIKNCRCHQPKPEVKCEHEKALESVGHVCGVCHKKIVFTPASTEVKCCRLCRDFGINKECPCQKSPASTEVKCNKGCMAENCAKECDDSCVNHDPASTEEWEKEFESRFENSDGYYTTAIEVSKDFIRSHDQQLRQRIVEGIKENERLIADLKGDREERDNYFYNLALREILTFITNLK